MRTIQAHSLTDAVRDSFQVEDLKPRARKHHLYRISFSEPVSTTFQDSISGTIHTYTFSDGKSLVISPAWGEKHAYIR